MDIIGIYFKIMKIKYNSLGLVNAAERGDLKTIKRKIRWFADVNSEDVRDSALSAAAFHGHYDCVDYLIKKGANVNFSCCEVSPLRSAAYKGHLTCLQILVLGGAVIDLPDDTGKTALRLAAEEGHIECVKFLVDHGANCLNGSDSGFTPFRASIFRCHKEVALFFVQHGSDPFKRYNGMESAYEFAKNSGRSGIAELIGSFSVREEFNALSDGINAELEYSEEALVF